VEDNGAGFDMAYVTSSFGFFSVCTTLKIIQDGVGLAIVHRIVTRHGGRIWAQGKPTSVVLSVSLPMVAAD